MFPLIGIHAALGMLGVAAYLWLFVEMLAPTKERVLRIRWAAIIGLVAFVLAGIAGGVYFVRTYDPLVAPMIEQSTMPWAQMVVMQTKLQLFLFLPFLGAFTTALIVKYAGHLHKLKQLRMHVLLLSGLIIVVGTSMAMMGYAVSASARSALEALVQGFM